MSPRVYMWRLLVLLLLHPVSATELASLKEDEDAYAGEASTVDGQLISLVQAKGADDPSLVSELLSNGASPSASGLYNYTAIMWAVVRHKVATLQALLDAGGDPSPTNAWSRHTRLAGSMLLLLNHPSRCA